VSLMSAAVHGSVQRNLCMMFNVNFVPSVCLSICEQLSKCSFIRERKQFDIVH